MMQLEAAIREKREEEERDERRKVEEKEKSRRSKIKLKVILAIACQKRTFGIETKHLISIEGTGQAALE